MDGISTDLTGSFESPWRPHPMAQHDTSHTSQSAKLDISMESAVAPHFLPQAQRVWVDYECLAGASSVFPQWLDCMAHCHTPGASPYRFLTRHQMNSSLLILMNSPFCRLMSFHQELFLQAQEYCQPFAWLMCEHHIDGIQDPKHDVLQCTWQF